MPGPWKKVVYIESEIGPRGGEYWCLTLECGHFAFKNKPKFSLTKLVNLPFNFGFAPKKCRCLMCHLRQNKKENKTMPDNPVELTLFYHDGTDQVIQASDDGKNKKWIALSLCEEVGEPFFCGMHKEIKITIPEWVAFERYLI